MPYQHFNFNFFLIKSHVRQFKPKKTKKLNSIPRSKKIKLKSTTLQISIPRPMARATTYCPMNPSPPTASRPHADVHRDNPKSQINHHQNPNRNLHVMLLKTQTQISYAPPPQIKIQTHRLALLVTDQRCWRWVGFTSIREIFALVDQVHAELEVGGGERREEKGENSPDWHRSMGWSCVGVWVDIGPSMECGVELRLSIVGAWGWS